MFRLVLVQRHDVTSPRARRRCAGLSTLEFIGCLTAVLGGAWIGAIYLGVDVKKAAHTALAESKLLDKMPAEWRPEDPQEKAMTRDQLLATLREELGSLRQQISSLRNGKAEGGDAEVVQPGSDIAAVLPTKDRTLAYWSRLNEISLGEADLQREAEAALSAANAASVFAIKGRISRFAAKAVVAVPTQAVDDEALRFGRQLGLWYDRGGEIYERAVRIWETPIGAQARTQLNDEWKQADEHHRNEAKLVNQKATAVRGTISRIYGTEFPEFGKPATPNENKETNDKSA